MLLTSIYLPIYIKYYIWCLGTDDPAEPKGEVVAEVPQDGDILSGAPTT